MRFIKNSIMILAVLGIVGLGCSMKVEACSYTSGCGSKSQLIECGPSGPPMASSSHMIMENNGYTEKCIIRTFTADHTIKCAGCGHVFASGERRTCSTIHSYKYCAPTYGQCQY